MPPPQRFAELYRRDAEAGGNALDPLNEPFIHNVNAHFAFLRTDGDAWEILFDNEGGEFFPVYFGVGHEGMGPVSVGDKNLKPFH